MDFAFAVAVLFVLFYLMLRTRRMKMRLIADEEPGGVKRNVIIIRHRFDEEQPVSPEMTGAVPSAAGE